MLIGKKTGGKTAVRIRVLWRASEIKGSLIYKVIFRTVWEQVMWHTIKRQGCFIIGQAANLAAVFVP